MILPLLTFARLCRSAGIRISTAEILDGIAQVEKIDLCDEEQFRTTLRAAFIKDRADQPRFARLYDLFFHQVPAWLEKNRHRDLSRHLLETADPKDTVFDGQTTEPLVDPLAGDPAAFVEELFNFLNLEVDEPEIPFSRLSPGQREILTAAGENERRGDFGSTGGAEGRRLGDLLMERLGIALQKSSAGEEKEEKKVAEGTKGGLRQEDIAGIAFSRLTAEEAREVHRAIERLAKKLKDQVTRRYARKKRGTVDIRRTIRRSARYDGLPAEIRYRRKPPRKTKIVALCDVSYSVWTSVPFMLNVLYSLQECFSQVRSFVFIASVADVSETMEGDDIGRAVEGVMERFRLRSPRNAVYDDEKDRDPEDADPEISDYGAALEQFRREFSDVLDRRTTLVILGDGRNNFLEPRPEILETLRERCRRVLWLNPEGEPFWDKGDSRVGDYRPYCDDMRPCGNLKELADFVTSLILF